MENKDHRIHYTAIDKDGHMHCTVEFEGRNCDLVMGLLVVIESLAARSGASVNEMLTMIKEEHIRLGKGINKQIQDQWGGKI